MSLYLGENLISGNKPINLGVRNIGEIVASPLPLTDAGLHLLDGSLILGGGIYQGFVDYIADLYTANPSANYFTDETTWQNNVTAYGVCGKFVYDSMNNTVRLPKVTGIIEGTTDVRALGDLVEAGLPSLPQHTHNYTRFPQGSTYLTRFQYTGGSYPGEAGWGYQTVQSDGASTVTGGLYGKSSTVRPQTIKCYYYIVIANSTKTQIQSDIDEIATDLNGKADVDLTNVNNAGYIKMAKAGMPSSRYVDLTFGASGSQYTAPANGWFAAIGYSNTAAARSIELSNNIKNLKSSDFNDAGWTISCLIPVSKGDIIYLYYSALQPFTSTQLRFIYAVGSESEAS